MADSAAHIWAVLAGNTVVNVVVADDEFAKGRPDHVRIDTLSPRPGPGWVRAGAKWNPPAPRAPLHDALRAPHELPTHLPLQR